MDKNDKKIIAEQEALRNLIDSPGWKIALERKETIVKKLMDLREFPNLSAAAFAKEVELRKNSVALLEDFIRIIIGEAEMYENNVSLLDEAKDDLIVRK